LSIKFIAQNNSDVKKPEGLLRQERRISRYQEHTQAHRNNNFGYSNDILNTRHTHGTETDDIDVIKRRRKANFEIYITKRTNSVVLVRKRTISTE
jgi:hypothetical protein